jgi:para-nitrobenzyl esterase
MTRTAVFRLMGGAAMLVAAMAGGSVARAQQVKTDAGVLEGAAAPEAGVRAYKGVPFAAPPVGDLRWRAPRPVAPWKGVRKATEFGPRCMQAPIFGDMVFRDTMSEDCLYLNVWTPAKTEKERLPVMVWVHGGGFQAGSGSEPRQDGGRLATKGVVVVDVNYRLGVFGFLAHPELTKESEHHASGNYGMLDQVAALEWVRKNIAAFGGDPKNVTIFGESAGSFAVSALMASPLSRDLFQKAIGESGAMFNSGRQALAQQSLAETEKMGAAFATSAGATSLAALRAKSAEDVLAAATKQQPWFSPNVDGYFLPRDVPSIYAEGKQSHVPLLAGWNADEVRSSVTLGKPPTAASYAEQVRANFGPDAEAVLKAYPATTDAEALESAAALASDGFIGYVTWKWIEAHGATGRQPIYRFSFDQAPPIPAGTMVNGREVTAKDVGARHAGEIEYVFGALDSSPKVPWTAEDRKLSDVMMTYWTNFAKTGDPNGAGLAKWPAYDKQGGFQVMHLDGDAVGASPDAHRNRYEAIDASRARAK